MVELDKSPENIKEIIETLNKRGFILEDKAYKVLSENFRGFEFEKSKPLINKIDGNKTEIDLFVKTDNKILVVECKRTDYSWFFPKNIGKKDRISFIIDSNNGIRTKSRDTNDFKVVYSDLPLRIDINGKLKKETPSRKDVGDHLEQLMRAIQTYLINLRTPEDRFLNKSLIPIIITNASLFVIDYSDKELDNAGDLKDYQRIDSLPFLAYNYSQILKWDVSQTVGHVGTRNIEDSEHLKTIFIVNIQRLKEFIDVLLLQDP